MHMIRRWIAAVILLTLALRELKGMSRVEVFCETKYLSAYVFNWIPLWKERGGG